MIERMLSVALLATASLTPAMANADPVDTTAPSFADLEASYAATGALARATAALAPSLEPATPLAAAQRALTDSGARCWEDHHKTGVVKCLYHQYDLSDGAADDIRWMIVLHSDGMLLRDFTVSREVDRHGGA